MVPAVRDARGYAPETLLTRTEEKLDASSAGVAGLHLFTFNQIAETERWRRAVLERLGAEFRAPERVYDRGRGWNSSPAPGRARIAQRKTTVRLPSTMTRLSLCHFTAWARTCASTSRPTVTRSPGSRE